MTNPLMRLKLMRYDAAERVVMRPENIPLILCPIDPHVTQSIEDFHHMFQVTGF